MIKFSEATVNLNRECEHFIETTDGDKYCKSERIEKALSVVEGHPQIMECKGCYNYGVRGRLDGPVKKTKKRNVKKKKKKSKTNKKMERAVKGLEVGAERAKKKSNVKTLGKKK